MVKFLMTNPRYLQFWFSTWFSTIGFWIRNMVLIYVVLDLSHNSSKALSINMALEYAPIVFAPVLGVFADRWNRKWTYVWGMLIRAGLIAGISIGVISHALLIVYAATFLGSVVAALMSPTAMAFVSELVDTDDRKTATSLEQMVGSTLMIIGPPIGAAIFTILGGVDSLWICAGFYVVSFLLAVSIRLTNDRGINEKPVGFFRDLKDGFGYTKRHTLMRGLLWTAGIIGLGAGIINVLEVFVVTEFLHLPKTMLSVLMAIQGVAMLLSIPLISRVKIPPSRLMPIGLIIGGMGFFIMVSVPMFAVTVVGYLIMSVGQMALNIAATTIMRTDIELKFQGRCMSLFFTVQSGLMAVMTMATGWVHEFISVQILIIICGGITCLGGLILYPFINKWTQHNPATITESR